MNKIKFIIFALLDHTYKLGHKTPDQVIFTLLFLQSFVLIVLFILMDRFFNFSIISYSVSTRSAIIYTLILYYFNYRYFITNSGAEKLIEQFENDEINTRKNRRIARFKFFALLISVVTIFFLCVLFFRLKN